MNTVEKYVDILAWELVACGQQPPLHPTTCAVIRVLWALGEVSFREMCCVVPCAIETVRQQLNRMVNAGVASRQYIKRMGRTADCVYKLTAQGVRMVTLWEVAAVDMKERLLERLEQRRREMEEYAKKA